jgi:sulfhydrogenase subunit beta (sulfur reductase)
LNVEAKTIRKKDVASFLDSLVQDYEVFAPLKRDGLILFETIASGSEALLDYQNSKMSPKDMLFPQSERLFSYSSTKGEVRIEAPPAEKMPQLIFGIRPCDAIGFTLLDKVFAGDFKDPYYGSRKAHTLVVSIGCVRPQGTCFCTSVDGGPFSAEGSDLSLIDIGDEYVVRISSEKGAKFLEKSALADAEETTLALAGEVIETAEAAIRPSFELEGLKRALDKMFKDPVWQELTEKCLGCGVCTYLCPTCHCFDITDEAGSVDGERVRTWDSCQFPLFTLQASGVNPRPTVKERFRQRVMHKFSYLIDDQEQIGCVGCGRCVIECPVNLDIRRVLAVVAKMGGAK